MGIKKLKFTSNVNEIVIQYKLVKKYPKPKNHPYKKALFLLIDFFFWKIKIKNELKVAKLISKILYGGKLRDVNAPITIKNKNSK